MNKFLKNQHFECRGLPRFSTALRGWLRALQIYSKAVPGSYPWDYRERACIGFLAAGIWRSGGVALEEWTTSKRSEEEKRKGRCDLWAYHRGFYDYHIEAKHRWSNPTRKRTKEIVERALNNAASEARRLTCPPDLKLGILSVAPVFPAGEQHDMDGRLAEWLAEISSIPHDAIAWQFRSRAALRPTRKAFCPGLVLLARKPRGTRG